MDGQVRHICNWDIDLQFTILLKITWKYSRLIYWIFVLLSKVSKTLEKKSVLSNLKFLVRETQKVKQTLLRKVSPTDYEQKYSNMMVWKIYASSSVFCIHIYLYHMSKIWSNVIFLYISAGYDIRVQRCFAFDETDTWWWLVDERGCRDDKLISEFAYDKSSGSAEATIYSMFRLPHSNRTYFQCDVAICKGTCPKHDCSKEKLKLEDKGNSKNLF